MEIKKTDNRQQEGFALLITLIVVGVVLSVGLTILDLSIKQVKLSTNARESEVSFHAANAGAECARYWRRTESANIIAGQQIAVDCFGEASINVNPSTPAVTGNGNTYQYEYSFTWGGGSRCTEINTLVAVADPIGVGVTTTLMTTLVPGYPKGDDMYCEAGSQCTVLSVRGYNRPCATVNGYGTVQREVLLQF